MSNHPNASTVSTTPALHAPIRLAYFLRIPNVGDSINPAVVTAISGTPTIYHSSSDQPHLLAVGSIMGGANDASHVWGSGVMHPRFGVGTARADNVYAVRGKLTYTALQSAGASLSDVPLGDPGFLAPRLLGISKTANPRFRLGLVPHYVDRRNSHFKRLAADPGVQDLNVHWDVEQFLNAMAECEVVISSSLHELIFAEALGIPNLWVEAMGEIGGTPFKYDDWFSTTEDPQKTVHQLTLQDTPESLAQHARLHRSMIDTEALKAAFPCHRIQTLQEAQPRQLLQVQACRSQPLPVFLISFNRGAMLKQAIAALKKQSRPTTIVVHDNGSTDEYTLRVLRQLEDEGHHVVRRAAIKSADD